MTCVATNKACAQNGPHTFTPGIVSNSVSLRHSGPEQQSLAYFAASTAQMSSVENQHECSKKAQQVIIDHNVTALMTIYNASYHHSGTAGLYIVITVPQFLNSDYD